MDDILLLEAIERYLNDEMSPQEKAYFEKLRIETPDIDQMVVEHSMFLHQIETFGEHREFKHQLHLIHNKLAGEGTIADATVSGPGKVIQLWTRYKRVVGIAASIACVTALVISALVTYFTPSNDQGIRALGRQIQDIKNNLSVQSRQINDIQSKVPSDQHPVNGGTSFLVDGSGYLITNAHVLNGSATIVVQNTRGESFKAVIAHLDKEKDIAVLKIKDEDFKPINNLPYSIRKGNVDLGEQIFTLGYPRDEIVYNEGYLSAKTGYNGDTVNFQIAVSANPGNSGGPVFNKYGEVIGVLSTAQQNAEGVVFAIKSRNIYGAVEDLKDKDTASLDIKMPAGTAIRNLSRVQQIKKVEDCVFMVRTYTR